MPTGPVAATCQELLWIFERPIGLGPPGVDSCAGIKRINTAELFKNLTASSTRVTARADEELDQAGKVKKDGPAFPAPAPATTASEFGENTVVVEREPQSSARAATLFKA